MQGEIDQKKRDLLTINLKHEKDQRHLKTVNEKETETEDQILQEEIQKLGERPASTISFYAPTEEEEKKRLQDEINDTEVEDEKARLLA